MRTPLLIPGVLIVFAVWLWPLWEPAPRGCLLAAAGCVVLGGLTRRDVRRFALLSAVFLLGCGVPGLTPRGPTLQGDAEVEGAVVATTGRTADLALTSLNGEPAAGRLRLRFFEPPPPVGSHLWARGAAQPPWRAVLPGDPDPSWEAVSAHISSTLKVKAHAVEEPLTRCDGFSGAHYEGLLRALACGDRSGIDEETDALLTRTGTRHLLAVSGLHVGTVALMFRTLLWALIRPLALLWPGGRLRWLPTLGAVAVAWSFAWLSGWSVSSQRAALMTTGVFLALADHRTALSWNLWGFAAALVALLSPASVRGISFQLSFGAVAGILLVVPRLTRLLPPDLPRPLMRTVQAVAATVGATAGTLPVSAWIFQDLPLIAPVSNLLALPAASLIVPSAVAARAGLPFQWLAEGGLWVLLTVLNLLDAPILHPAVGPVGVVLLMLGVLRVRWPLESAVMFLLALGLRAAPPEDELHVTFLSVGQGDAALVEVGGRRLLVDGGPGRVAVTRYLRRRGLRHLDAVVLSHPHPDHARGLTEVLSALTVDALWLPRLPLAEEADFLALTALAAQQNIPIHLPGDPGLDALLPTPTLLTITDEDPNEGSLVFRLTHGDTSLLFTGDIERQGEAALLPLAEPISWLKVAHHGSRSSSEATLIDRLAPRAAVLSCGLGNRYGHPAPEVVRRFYPGRLFRTDRDGTVQLRSDGHTESSRTWAPGQGWSDWQLIPDRRAAPLPPPPPIPAPTTLAEAAHRGTLDEVHAFLAAGADPHTTTRAGDTPLSLAIEGGNLPTAQLLHDLGAPFNGPRPPLCDAARYARRDILDWLLQLSRPPDVLCRDGTPLHMAVRSWGHDIDTLQRLLAAGADPHSVDDAGRSPLDLARALNKPLRADLLERAQHETLP